MLGELDRAVARLGLAGGRVLVAASAGLDSTALAHALAARARLHRIEPCLGHVHHGLRGEAADADAAFVADLAARLGIPHRVRRVDPAAARRGGPSRDRPTLQEAARALRYAALDGMARELGATHVATAHNADDQAETVLLRLLRGTGPDGLAGIPERSDDGRVVRPLLRVSRAEIQNYAATEDLSWREDASNGSDAYARNRLRRHWLPALAREFNPRLLRAVADLAEAQQRDTEWIRTRVERECALRFHVERGWLHVDAKDWGALPETLARRLARAALERAGAGRLVTRTHLERTCAFLVRAAGGRTLELPGGLQLRREASGFRLGPLRGSAPSGRETPC